MFNLLLNVQCCWVLNVLVKFIECCVNLRCDLQQFLKVDGCDWKDLVVSLRFYLFCWLLMDLCFGDAKFVKLQFRVFTTFAGNPVTVPGIWFDKQEVTERCIGETISDFESLIFSHVFFYLNCFNVAHNSNCRVNSEKVKAWHTVQGNCKSIGELNYCSSGWLNAHFD